ncbi:MAG TPA: S8 family serine peptidase, partial [Candidatus Thermoplasmatota archaeon]|nr:S8 family serine peptidase [Candidatus Thermoplasmatota archaeon]
PSPPGGRARAGNVGPCSDCVAFPARDARVVAAAAVDASLAPAAFSAGGPQVDLAAPGVGILSTFDDGGYAAGSGTSQAAAWVAGAAALVREHAPGLDAAQVREALRAGAADVGPAGPDARTGAGLLDVAGALRAAEG